MNEQDPKPIPDPTTPPPAYRDWREQRRAERWARHEARWQKRGFRHTGWFAGLLLILLGVVLLLEELNIPFLANWWALFILIPAFWAYMVAWDIYQDNSRLTRRCASSLTVGILLTILTLVFLFNLAAGHFWPALLIMGGLALLGTSFLPE